MGDENQTWIDKEELAYSTPSGSHWGSKRKGRVLFPDGKLRIVTLGIPDTMFSIPGHDSSGGVGFVSVHDGDFEWTPQDSHHRSVYKVPK